MTTKNPETLYDIAIMLLESGHYDEAIKNADPEAIEAAKQACVECIANRNPYIG